MGGIVDKGTMVRVDPSCLIPAPEVLNRAIEVAESIGVEKNFSGILSQLELVEREHASWVDTLHAGVPSASEGALSNLVSVSPDPTVFSS